MLPKIAVEEFKSIYSQKYGSVLTDELAFELGERLKKFVKAVYGNDLPKTKTIDSEKN